MVLPAPVVDPPIYLVLGEPPIRFHHVLEGPSGVWRRHRVGLHEGIYDPERAVDFDALFLRSGSERAVARYQDSIFNSGHASVAMSVREGAA